jgi:hypothetical protein
MLPVTVAWLPAEEYAEWPEHWPDLAGSALLQDEKHGGTVAHAGVLPAYGAAVA